MHKQSILEVEQWEKYRVQNGLKIVERYQGDTHYATIRLASWLSCQTYWLWARRGKVGGMDIISYAAIQIKSSHERVTLFLYKTDQIKWTPRIELICHTPVCILIRLVSDKQHTRDSCQVFPHGDFKNVSSSSRFLESLRFGRALLSSNFSQISALFGW